MNKCSRPEASCNNYVIEAPIFAQPPSNTFEDINYQIMIFPNPFTNQYTLDIKGIDWEHNIISYELYDITGRKLDSKRLMGEQTVFVLDDSYASGINMARIKQNGTKLKELKLIKASY